MAESAELRRITTKVPSRLDRLPWARWHWLVVVGLGTVWILDGLEVTIVGSIAAIWEEPGNGLEPTSGQVDLAGSVYVAGACIGPLFFGPIDFRQIAHTVFAISNFVGALVLGPLFDTVGEIFPMETRAPCIASLYAIGTAAGGIAGPLLFGKLAEAADPSMMMIGYLIGAALMLVGGL